MEHALAHEPETGRMRPEIELKYLVVPDAVGDFVEAVGARLHEEAYEPDRPVAWTRTTYLDTLAREYLRSESPLRRLRVREYASARALDDEPALTGICFLELKESRREARRKTRHRLSAGEAQGIVAGAPPLVGEPELRRCLAEPLLAVATTWYRRRAFVARGIRITVDERPWLCRPVLPGTAPARPPEPVRVLPAMVLEVKLVRPTPGWLIEVLGTLPAPRSFSKFRQAAAAVG